MNGSYIRELPTDELVALIVERLVSSGLADPRDVETRPEWYAKLAPLVEERLKRLDEIVPKLAFLFTNPRIEDAAREKVLQKEGVAAALAAATEALAPVEFSAQDIEAALRTVPEKMGVKPKVAFQAVRVAVTGTTVSPPLFESLELLGKERHIGPNRCGSGPCGVGSVRVDSQSARR